jgi:hypothetical protein
MKKNVIKFGEIVYAEGSVMPQLQINIIDNTDSENPVVKRVYYLSPFRLYRFQVSGSLNGSGDYGASPVVGLGNIVGIRPNTPVDTKGFSAFSSNIFSDNYGQCIMKSMAYEAIVKFYSHRMNLDEIPDRDEIVTELQIGDYSSTQLLNTFIDEVYKYTVTVTASYR